MEKKITGDLEKSYGTISDQIEIIILYILLYFENLLQTSLKVFRNILE